MSGTEVEIPGLVQTRGRYSLYVDIGDQIVHLHPSEFADAESSEPPVSASG